MKTLFEKMRDNRHRRIQVEMVQRRKIEDQKLAQANMINQNISNASGNFGGQIRGAALGGPYGRMRG